MKYKTLYNSGEKFGIWTLSEFIDSGGNGEVWKAKNKNGNINALKLLKNIKKKSYSRFPDEIRAVKKNSDIRGVLPIIDFYLPESIFKEKPWYVMPLATPFEKYIEGKNTQEIIDLLILLAEELWALHKRKVFHRDIKPANLFFYNGYPCLGDFGLVDFPEKKELTSRRETVGPKWTIAPEMKRNAYKADGGKADTYSFAKTIWILLTKESLSFDGQYNSNGKMGLNRYLKDIYTKPLDDLLVKCTDNDPQERPNLKQVATSLKKWKEINNDYQKRNKEEWKEIQGILFPAAMPERVIWTSIEDITCILNLLAKSDNLNHMFFPKGGGLDLTKVSPSIEEYCIEINADGLIFIVKPKRLLFESFNSDPQWNYFRLETSQIEPISDKKYAKHGEEPLTEITTGQYSDYECYEYNDFNGQTLPNTARQIVRILHGDFVLFAKTSIYNKVSATYDGRHNKVNSDEFRKYIEMSINNIDSKKKNPNPTCLINYSKSTNVRKGRMLNNKELKLFNEIISIADKVAAEEDRVKEKYEIEQNGLDLFNQSTYQYMNEIRPAENKLEQFLNTLTNEDIVLIASVMYAGRDYISGGRCRTLDEMVDFFSKKGDLKDSITEKAPLAQYLRNGIQAYT